MQINPRNPPTSPTSPTRPIRCVIADDEPLARRGIMQLVAPYRDIEVAGEARNGLEAVQLLKALTPDLVFLDIQMPELDGFGVLQQLARDAWPVVIFVTAYDTFAVRAFDAHAVDYLVKPIHEHRFGDAVARARARVHGRWPARLVISGSGGEVIVDVTEIEWIEAEDYYAVVHARGRRHLMRESLVSLAARLDGRRFVRVHRSALVNLEHVREVRTPAQAEASVLLRSGVEVPLSRRRRDAVTAAVRRFS
jgi:two-component system LytT family response regulator